MSSGNEVIEKRTTVKQNFALQLLYQTVIIVLPLVISPFLTRRLGDTALGNFSYVNSYATYFITFAMLGISAYGSRIISQTRNNTTELRKTFWSLFIIHFVASCLAIIGFSIMAYFATDNQKIYYIEILYVLSALFDISFLFSGLENFKTPVIINLIIKLSGATLIFTLINNPEDILKYTLINASEFLISNLIMFVWALIFLKPIKFTLRDCTRHIKPMLILFVSSVAATLYTTFDKTLLGLISTKESVAYYVYADKIIGIPKSLILVIFSVIYPRICALYQENKIDQISHYNSIALEFVSIFGIGTLFGLLSVGEELATVYYGQSFSPTGEMLLWMSPLAYIVCLGALPIYEYLLPKKMDMQITIITIVCAIINIGSSILFFYIIGPCGVILGSILSEIIGSFIRLWYSRYVISFKDIILNFIPYCVIGALMFGVLYLINLYWDSWSVLHLIALILIGATIYILLTVLYLLTICPGKTYWRHLAKKAFHIKQ